ncbi:hypothetical protein ACFE04_003173 [Oxalis oulophora]
MGIIIEGQSKKISVLMFPWLAHGHISPFLELAKKLTQRNFRIFFCSTPINLNSVKTNLIHGNYLDSIQLVELHLPSSPEFPPRYHTTKDLPPHLMSTLKQVLDSSSSNFFDILKTLEPDLLICDFLMPWAPKIASSLNIPSVVFPTNSASVVSLVVHAIKNPKTDFPFKEFSDIHGMSKAFEALRSSCDGQLSDNDRIELSIEQSRDIVLIKTFKELEGKYFVYLSNLLNKKIVPVGALVQDPIKSSEDFKGMEIMKWLDNKKQSSTIFVSFGSELVESVGVGIEVKRDVNGNYGSEEIARAIKEVVEEETGGHIRMNVREMSQCIENNGEEEIDEVVHELLKLIPCA